MTEQKTRTETHGFVAQTARNALDVARRYGGIGMASVKVYKSEKLGTISPSLSARITQALAAFQRVANRKRK